VPCLFLSIGAGLRGTGLFAGVRSYTNFTSGNKFLHISDYPKIYAAVERCANLSGSGIRA